MKNFYEVMQVAESATQEEIRTSYKVLAKKYHPDLNPNDPKALENFKSLNEANDILSDATKRAQYDNDRRGFGGGGAGMGGGFNRGGPDFNYTANPHNVNFDEILRDMLHRQGRAYGQHSHQARNRDFNIAYNITLEEAYTGKEADVHYTMPSKGQQTQRIVIPRGVQSGVRLLFAGKGDDSIAAIPAGNLYIMVNVVPHQTYQRHGMMLGTLVEMDYLDAIVGKAVDLDLLDGSTIRLKIPKGANPGQTLRIAGKGMVDDAGNVGDLLIELNITAPTLTEEQISAIQKIKSKKSG
jgi:DnaJ-class molecular chaperone